MTTNDKSIVQEAMAALIATGDVDALAPVLSDDFVHHKPDATSSTKKEWLDEVRAALPHIAGMRVEIQHVLAGDGHVVMYSRRWLPGAEPGIAVVDIWRLQDGLIVEAWEIIEPVAQVAANLSWWETVA
jgi:predicted SnoaL-like aldol condensation-catalyzing enzyme